MTETENKNRLIQDKKMTILGMKLEMSNNSELINRIVFKCKDEQKSFNITYKPKHTEQQYVGDFQAEVVKQSGVADLPEILQNIAIALKEKGSIKVKGKYLIWEKDNDGEIQEIRYVGGSAMVEAWEIL